MGGSENARNAASRETARDAESEEDAGAPLRAFSTVSIVGVGLIGGSLALALRRAGFRGVLRGASRPETLAQARALGAIDEGFPYERLGDAVAGADLVVLASPIRTITEHLAVLGRTALEPGAVITDVGSTKREIVAVADKHLPPAVTFIGGHPLAGSELRGVAAADPFLFQNAYYVLTPSPATAPGAPDRLAGFLGAIGARVVLLDPEEHDRVAAAISHLPQLLAVSLVRFLDDLGPLREHALRLAAGGFRDMTRIASSPYSVWHDIVDTNRDLIGEAFGSFERRAGSLFGALGSGALKAAFDDAARTRGTIPRDTKGFLSRLWDVLVVVEDRPGIIAGISAPLAERGINVKDIEVLKVREGEGGSIRLAFASEEAAREAVEVLRAHGFEARDRAE